VGEAACMEEQPWGVVKEAGYESHKKNMKSV
jgi:hypothetical protein